MLYDVSCDWWPSCGPPIQFPLPLLQEVSHAELSCPPPSDARIDPSRLPTIWEQLPVRHAKDVLTHLTVLLGRAVTPEVPEEKGGDHEP